MKQILKNGFSRNLLLVAVGLILLLGIVLVLELTDKTFLFHKRQATSGTIPITTTPADNTDTSKTPKETTDDTPKTDDKKPSGATDAVALKTTPYGTFVSNHRPSLSGTGSPSKIQSVCTTDPGVSCRMEFKMGDAVKTIPTKTTNSAGVANWEWDVKQAGFVAGTWTITVIAESGGKSLTATDQLNLEVQP